MLVIGASGLLGSKIMELGMQKYEVYGTYSKNNKDGLTRLDVKDRKQVFDLLGGIKPDLVVDSHGLNNVDYAESHREELWATNDEGSKNVAEASQNVGAKYIFISSDYVFSGKKRLYTEKDRPDPVNYLGKGKWALESILEILDIDYIVARTSGLYGKGSSTGKKSFVQFIVENLQKGIKTEVISDQYSSPTLVDDVANSLFALSELNQNGIFHIVGKDCLTKYDFAKHICKEFGLDSSLISPCSTASLSQAARRPDRVRMSTSKLRKITLKIPAGVKEGLRMINKQ
jgi:dTDP-4-dehydrorhamnose reductase